MVLIVGAGPTGLALALWLTRLGVSVRIIDKTAQPGTTSRALAVQTRTLEYYRQLGIADLLVEGGVSVAGLNLWAKGKRAGRLPLRDIGEGLTPFPFALVYPQDAHERLLIDELSALGVSVERRTELIRFEEHGDGVQATIRTPAGTDEKCDADYIAGCDGASSTVREHTGIGFPGGTYEGLFYVADVDAIGDPVDQELHVDLEQADFLLVIPLKEPGRLRVAGAVRGARPDAGRPLGFDDVRGRALEHLGLEATKVNWFSTYRVHHRVADSFRRGRAFLLGDAAHIHSPVGGQGMNTGIGDAVNLAWKLAAVIHGEAARTLLDTYEPERIAFARRLVATTDRLFMLVSRQGPIARIVRTRIAPLVIPFLFRLGPSRDFLFRTVSQVGVNYRGSKLSEGATEYIESGDRLPWLQFADNFAPLASLQWQVHVYGDPRGGLGETCAELGLELHSFLWTNEARAAGFERGAIYLIRPDGYVALADALAETATLRGYFVKRGIRTPLRPPSGSVELALQV